MPNVALVRAAHEVVVAHGLGNARNWGRAFEITLPVLPGAVDVDALLPLIRGLEFVKSAEWDGTSVRVSCRGEGEA